VTDPVRDAVERALAEDRAHEDITTAATVRPDARGRARLIAAEPCVVAGTDLVRAAFEALDPDITVVFEAKDGDLVDTGAVLAVIEGRLAPMLAAERTALNFVQRLSGIATVTRAAVAAAPGLEVRDTRKTTPGLRTLEKAAVRAGGGTNHRTDLAAAILIKDNHIVAAGGIEPAVRAAKATGKHVEVECDTLEQVRAAVAAGADEILLDNMTPTQLREAVTEIAGRARTEASGGITLANLAEVAATGVDAVSLGALTHSAPAIDLTLEIEAVD
jgi:nicotinate-nucleotide pyrophosphorylase (carboxylating)